MSDSFDRHLDEALHETQDLIRRAKKVENALASKRISVTDDDNVVRATVTGTGDLVDIEISNTAMTYPGRLGKQMSVALMRALRTARVLTEKAKEKYVPELPVAEHTDMPSEADKPPIDFHAIDFNGPVEAKNAIAEAMEAMRKAEQTAADFKRRRVKQELQAIGGYIEVNPEMTSVKVVIAPELPRQIGLEQLSSRVISGVAQAAQRAAEVRANSLKAVHLSTGSVGDMLQATAERIEKHP
ncbi:YbaB/EbfC family nucleoid-associated protein [Spirillospora sp. NBC_00431]